MKRTLFIIVCMLTSITMLAQEESNNYIPFVEAGKTWHVESSPSSGKQYYKFLTYRMDEKVELDGKTYFKLKQEGDTDADVSDMGLFREEDGRVYTYDNMLDRDVMLYDFSLKEGDTFTYEIDPYSPMNCKVLKQGWLYDGPQIVSSVIPISPDSMEIRYRQLRTWTIGREIGPGEYHELSTWVEGVGSLKDTFIYPLSVGGICSLAYVERTDHETNYSKNSYLPFSFYNPYGRVHGCNLPIDVMVLKVLPVDGHSQLTYDLEGDHMHVYGNIYAQAGNAYAYFIEEETDDPLVRKLHFQIEDVDPIPTTMGLHATEFYVPGLNPNFDYIIVDNQGEEHPVVNRTPQKDYRPFVEDGKVWKVGAISSGNPVQWVEYYYFDGDTIIDGKTCKQMMCQRYVSPSFAEYSAVSGSSALNYVGAWYEEDKKVYEYDMTSREFQLMYDFSFEDPDTLLINHQPYVIGPKLTGGMNGFKGVYRDIMMWIDGEFIYSIPWLEGVGGTDCPTTNVYSGYVDPMWFLMSCTVGDEVIYLNDAYEDGATSVAAEARKRIDFTHTIKIRPKSRMLRETRQSLYGEYNDQQLGVNLVPLDDAYLVRIADETGRAVYEKAINAGSIVGLTIDISDYAKGRYTVTVENRLEAFTGEFEAQTTGISNALRPMKDEGIRNNHIYDLQGRRLTQKPTTGMYIQNGKKVVVK